MTVYTFCPYCHELKDLDTFLTHCLLDHPETEIAERIRQELRYSALVAS